MPSSVHLVSVQGFSTCACARELNAHITFANERHIMRGEWRRMVTSEGEVELNKLVSDFCLWQEVLCS